MPVINWNVILIAIAYAAITGVLNLILSERSRIDTWAEANPRLAGVMKLMRSFGFDPWNLIAAASLFFKSKLPDAVRAGKTLPPPPFAKPSVPTIPPIPPLPPFGMLALCLAALLMLGGCGFAAVAVPLIAKAALLIADGSNAVSAAEALLPLLHLDAAEDAQAKAAITKARQGLAAAAAADDGAKELTDAELDESLADFRVAWSDLQGAIAAKKIAAGNAAGALGLPVPLAVRHRVRVQQ